MQRGAERRTPATMRWRHAPSRGAQRTADSLPSAPLPLTYNMRARATPLSLSCANRRRRRTLHLLLCANQNNQSLNKEDYCFISSAWPPLFLPVQQVMGPSHAVSLGSEHSEENRWVPELYARLTYRRGHVESLTAWQEISSNVRFLE